VSQTELQKLIAFEEAYSRIFNLMQAEGGVAEGGIAIQDCLSLLANLIRHSTSNQSLFRETKCIPRLVSFLTQASVSSPDENEFSRVNREKNTWGLLAVIQSFMEKGEAGTKSNQDAFWRGGLLQVVLDLAFNPDAASPVRAMALRTCADMILANGPIQEAFAGLQVRDTSEAASRTNGRKTKREQKRLYVIEALLGLVLLSGEFDLRSSASTLIKAYSYGHDRIKHHFLQRAIAGFIDGEDASMNVLSTLMTGPVDTLDALRFIFASDIVSLLLFDNIESKGLLMGVSEGNAEKGEDVITSTQALAGHLTWCLQNDADPRITVSYLRLLQTLLYDSQPAVNDCLAEGSSLLSAIVSAADQTNTSQVSSDLVRSLIPGLSASLLGTIYEFSSKDSPIPRRTLQPFLVTRLGRQRYFEALKQLRQHSIVRDSEVAAESGPPVDDSQVLLDVSFLEWYKDEYGRLKRAIDKDSGIEVVAKTDAGVDRDVLDELRAQIASKDQAVQTLERQQLESKQIADQTSADHRKELQTIQSAHRSMESEVERIKRINEALQRDHDSEMSRTQKSASIELEKIQTAHRSATQIMQQQHEREMERVKGQHGASLASERSLWEEKQRKAVDAAARELIKKVEEAQQTAQNRQNEMVVLRNDFNKANTDLERAQQDATDARVKIDEVSKDLQRTKDLQDNLQQVNSKAMARMKTLEEESKRHISRHEVVEKEKDSLVKQISDMEVKVKELHAEVEGLKMELQEERKGYGELEKEFEKLKNDSSGKDKSAAELEKLQKELETQTRAVKTEKEEADKARTEMEDMLMVMSDIETKRDEYKERLKKLGEEISDDEDEEEEEDGDEEEEDGEEEA